MEAGGKLHGRPPWGAGFPGLSYPGVSRTQGGRLKVCRYSPPKCAKPELRVSLRRRAALQQPAIVEKGRPAPAPLLDKRRNPRRGAGVVIALQNLGGNPRALILILRGEHRSPVHAGCLELPRPHVVPQRRLTHAVEIFAKPAVDLRIVKPPAGFPMHLKGAGLKVEHMPAVLERCDVLVEGLPIVGDNHDPAL